MATAPATTRLPNIKGWVYDDEDSYCRVEDEEAREMVTDAYDPTATYTQGATCIQDNKLYRAKADITTAEVWTPDHWEGTSLEQIRKDMETEISTLNAKSVSKTIIDVHDGNANNCVDNLQIYMIRDGLTYPNANAPFDNSWSRLLCIGDSAGCSQLAFALNYIGIKYRYLRSGNWSNWTKII